MKGKNSTKVIAICLAAVLSFSLLGGIGTQASAANFTESVYVHKDIEIATGVRINITNFFYQQDSNGEYLKDNDGEYILDQETKRFIPTDVSGNTVTPFICNGTTYLPVRAISGIFNATIDWNTYYSSVFITTTPSDPTAISNPNPADVDTSKVTADYSQVPVVTGVNIYNNGDLWIPTNVSGQEVDVILMNGTTYLPIRALSNLFDANIEWDGPNYTATIIGTIPTEPSGDIEDDDDDFDIIQIIKDMIKEKLSQMFNLKGFIDKINALKEKFGCGLDLSKIIDAFKEKIGQIPDVDILSYLKQWAEEHSCDLGDIREKLGVGTTDEMVEAFKEKLQSYFDSYNPDQFKEILKGLFPNFDLEALLGSISGGVDLPDPTDIKDYIDKIKDISGMDIGSLIGAIKDKFPSYDTGSLIGIIKDKFPSFDTGSLIGAIKDKFPSFEIGDDFGELPDMSLGDFGDFIGKFKDRFTSGF